MTGGSFTIRAVLFDFAGVLTSSPWAALAEAGGGDLELITQGFDPTMVDRITRLVDLSEYKRRQNPPGPRISAKAFGKDRRMPITNGYRG